MRHAPRLVRRCIAAALIAVIGTAPALAIDRRQSNDGLAGEGPGYGAEREYSGAERFRGGYAGGKARYSGSEGSVVYFEDDDDLYDGDGDGGGQAGVYPGFGAASDGGFVEEDDPDQWTVVAGPRIIDLRGRRPIGVEVSHVGATRIVRIAANGDGATPSGEADRSPRAPLEPWSEAWARYCSRTHRDFDPSRGTFVDEAGATRFCTGE